MFNLFKKKEAPKAQPAEDKNTAYKAYAADFLPDVLDLMVVTGPEPFSSDRQPDSDLWEGRIGLTAWTEKDSDEIDLDPVQLVILAAQDLVNVVQQRLPSNFILKLKGRLSQDGKRMLLVDLPAPAFDPDLKELLEEQKKPVTFETEDLGTFTLSHAMGWFETDHDWLDGTVQLTVDRDSDREASLANLRTLLADCEGWNQRLAACAAQHRLERANQSLTEDGEEPMDEAQFIQTVQVESIQMGEDGSFTAVLNDNGLFWGNSIVVTGTLSGGPVSASVEDGLTELPD